MKHFFNNTIKYVLLLALVFINLEAKEKYTNKLINEDSPYLQQHAHNPVNWHAWNNESFKKAKDENKLIFLSIGYSTCHWCHVMEDESFENEEVAKILNKYFVAIKVDREEMPHVDKYYQNIHNLVNRRSGGWPLNLILTPKRKAFFAATYIPVEAKYGRAGIKELLLEIQSIFKDDKKRVDEVSAQIEKLMKEYDSSNYEKKDLNISLVNQFVKEVDASYDHSNFGIGEMPKFPHASTITTLLDIYIIFKNEKALELSTKMLKAMANGGIYDQIEGGFYRYSVDKRWMIPHFEKMLYTNAELLSAYSKAYDITGDEFYKNIVTGITNFTKKRFLKQNLLYSASDADSLIHGEKEEGAYFVFQLDEVEKFLEKKKYKKDEIEKIVKYFNITLEGNFESGLNNPYLTNNEIPTDLQKIKVDLTELRSLKKYPFIDYKILTSWNAMYISALFDAKNVQAENGENAIKLLDNLIAKLYVNNTLYHQKLIDKKPKVKALFEDYSFLIEALLKAYDYSLDKKYLAIATTLNQQSIKKFYKKDKWLMSDDEFKSLAGVYDSSYKSSLSVMLDNILKISLLKDDLDLQNIAKLSLENNSMILASQPSTTAWLLRTYIAFNKNYISLKATKNMLENKTYPSYPFLLKKLNDEKKYLACKIGVCFSYSEDFKQIIKEIEKDINK
jgi:uncharacterized protein YyaL (SSP411 family)